MSRIRPRIAKGRRESGAFAPVPCSVLQHPNFQALTSKSCKLLFDMLEPLRFKPGGPVNNGDINVTWSRLSKRGWKSRGTLWEAIRELEHYGFIKQTRQGWTNHCSLYGITWWAINHCDGKLDVRETAVASNEWKQVQPRYQPSHSRRSKNRIASTIIVKHCPDSRAKPDFSPLSLTDIWAQCPDSRVNSAVSLSR